MLQKYFIIFPFNYNEDKDTFEYFNYLSNNVLINLINYAIVFRKLFESKTYER